MIPPAADRPAEQTQNVHSMQSKFQEYLHHTRFLKRETHLITPTHQPFPCGRLLGSATNTISSHLQTKRLMTHVPLSKPPNFSFLVFSSVDSCILNAKSTNSANKKSPMAIFPKEKRTSVFRYADNYSKIAIGDFLFALFASFAFFFLQKRCPHHL
ncbi:hypothetical protein McpAg1_01080 [Methanocorpusculaceae archaeon Ag1]|uniref:Uncharacterized protein n=1 Tax=Methanorbis furvi TaxID=3028299 RepID=A0AAE4S990_9EURY|nr:hypothetical protein [Methanocorpusculaceae archaeon Ag1]